MRMTRFILAHLPWPNNPRGKTMQGTLYSIRVKVAGARLPPAGSAAPSR